MKDPKKDIKKDEPDGAVPDAQPWDMSQIMSSLMDQKDAREKAYQEMVKKLFDKDSLLMIARLSPELAYYIVKHQILLGMFQLYYEKIDVEIELRDEGGVLVSRPIYRDSKIPSYTHGAYKNIIDDILQITISYDGQGRREILETMMSAEAKMLQDELRKNKTGILGKFFG